MYFSTGGTAVEPLDGVLELNAKKINNYLRRNVNDFVGIALSPESHEQRYNWIAVLELFQKPSEYFSNEALKTTNTKEQDKKWTHRYTGRVR